MLMQKIEKYLSAILAVVIGILFIWLKGGVISVAMTVIGVLLIAMGIMDAINRSVTPAIIKIVFGAVIIAVGWAFVQVVLYLLATGLVIYGAVLIYNNVRYKVRGLFLWDTILLYATPVMWLVIGLLLFFNMNATVDGVLIAVGVFMLIQSVLLFLEALRKKR